MHVSLAFSLLRSFDLPVRLTPAMKASGIAIGKERRQESSLFWGTDDMGLYGCALVIFRFAIVLGSMKLVSHMTLLGLVFLIHTWFFLILQKNEEKYTP
jgi:hypothetical protein